MSHITILDEPNGNTLSLKPSSLAPSISTEDLSEYTDADESISAPTEYFAEFLSAVMTHDYRRALKYCKLILEFEPNNITAKEFYPLILEKISCDLSLAPFDVSLSGSGAQTTTDSSVTLEQSEGEQELAFWMLNDADDLHNYYVKINVPELYRSLNKSICEAGANSVDLGKLCKYFYEFGLHVSKFDDHNTIENMLLNTLRQRLTHIIDMCNCADVKSKRDSHFDCSEEKLYSSGCETFSAYHNWLTRDATESRIRNGKRKRSQMEVDDILKL
ncbi:DNA replication complex GINS protein PSF3 isoform X1 [Phlebotomus argentipes]|uniref:DNA replication complex GINS protein PSF3 isoform X1 n=1 Tax=Phlebotomus argentipes TaxID=94469 RepID=UPI002893455D|nr:DNA replication complex GINS protein PSF3 isoform X1 [Phlebotomus argentipes]